MSIMEGLYKRKVKEEFLKTIPHEQTRDYYARILVKCAPSEIDKGKDLYNFTKDEIAETLKTRFNSKTLQAYEVYGRVISSYIYWAIKNNIKKGKNPLSEEKHAWFKQFVDDETNLYFTDDQLEEVIANCKNLQDAIIFRLVFEGICGQKVVRLRELKEEDIDTNNNIIMVGNEKYHVEQRTIDLLEEAMDEMIYFKKNGTLIESKHNNIRDYADLVDNGYIMRSSITSTVNIDEPVDKFVIYRRASSISKFMGMEKSLTIKNVSRSGMIYYAYKIMKANNLTELRREDYIEIAHRFEVKSHYPVKRICNEKVVYKLYGDKLNANKKITV